MLKLGDYKYLVTCADIQKIGDKCLTINIVAIADDDNIPEELGEIQFTSDFRDANLFKDKYIEYNSPHGLINTVEFDDITKSVLNIRNIDKTTKTISFKWTGTANVNWNEKLGKNVPFEIDLITKYKFVMQYL